MTDIVIGQAKGTEIFVRDEDGDGTLDAGERIGVRGAGDRFDAARVSEALGRVGISGIVPGARIPRIGAYIDYLNEADRRVAEGDFAGARSQLDQAEEFAQDNNILINEGRIADLRWRAVDVAFERGAAGTEELDPKALALLRADDGARSRRVSARLVLDYLSTRSSIENIANSAGLGRDRLLEEREARASELEEEIAARAARLQTVLTNGGRETVADQTSELGRVFRVGDRVRQCDPETGETWGGAFIITGFEIRADGVVAHGEAVPTRTSSPYPREVNIENLAPAPSAPGILSAHIGPRSDWDRLIAQLDQGVQRLFTLIRE